MAVSKSKPNVSEGLVQSEVPCSLASRPNLSFHRTAFGRR
jgi:hypothetical protein